MSDPTYETGMRVRRGVLGDEHVDRAAAETTAFTAAFQDHVTRVAWAACGRVRGSTVARGPASRSRCSRPSATATRSRCTSGRPAGTG